MSRRISRIATLLFAGCPLLGCPIGTEPEEPEHQYRVVQWVGNGDLKEATIGTYMFPINSSPTTITEVTCVVTATVAFYRISIAIDKATNDTVDVYPHQGEPLAQGTVYSHCDHPDFLERPFFDYAVSGPVTVADGHARLADVEWITGIRGNTLDLPAESWAGVAFEDDTPALGATASLQLAAHFDDWGRKLTDEGVELYVIGSGSGLLTAVLDRREVLCEGDPASCL